MGMSYSQSGNRCGEGYEAMTPPSEARMLTAERVDELLALVLRARGDKMISEIAGEQIKKALAAQDEKIAALMNENERLQGAWNENVVANEGRNIALRHARKFEEFADESLAKARVAEDQRDAAIARAEAAEKVLTTARNDALRRLIPPGSYQEEAIDGPLRAIAELAKEDRG